MFRNGPEMDGGDTAYLGPTTIIEMTIPRSQSSSDATLDDSGVLAGPIRNDSLTYKCSNHPWPMAKKLNHQTPPVQMEFFLIKLAYWGEKISSISPWFRCLVGVSIRMSTVASSIEERVGEKIKG